MKRLAAVLSFALFAAACGDSSPATPSPSGSADAGSDGSTVGLAGLRADWRQMAAQYMEGRADNWLTSPPKVSNIGCAMSCHTTYPYTLARHALTGDIATPKAALARQRFEGRVAEGVGATPFYGSNADAKTKESLATEALLNATALSLDDVWSKRPLSPASTAALDLMWTTQNAEGTWAWLEFNLEPWETRNDYGAAMAVLLLGSIPENTTANQAAGTTKLLGYLRGRLPTMALHDRATLLWTSGYLKDSITKDQRAAIATEVAGKQLEDGGFSAGGWGKGSRAAQVAGTSDGYATALATLALCHETGHEAAVQKGLQWLAQSQAEDGSWPGQSVNTTSSRAKTFMTDAATAYAVLALTQCGKQ